MVDTSHHNYVWVRNVAQEHGFTEYKYYNDDDTRWKPLAEFDPHNGYFCPSYTLYITNDDSPCYIKDNISHDQALTWYLR